MPLETTCPVCRRDFSSNRDLMRHLRTIHMPQSPQVPMKRPPPADPTLAGPSGLPTPPAKRGRTIKPSKPQPPPTPPPVQPARPLPPQDPYVCEASMVEGLPRPVAEEYRANFSGIRTRYRRFGPQHHYNFRLRMGEYPDLRPYLRQIFRRERRQFLVNVTMGSMLQRKPNTDYEEVKDQLPARYFWPSHNRYVFDQHIKIYSEAAMQQFDVKIEDVDLEYYGRKDRDNTQWRLYGLAAVRFDVIPLEVPLIGRPANPFIDNDMDDEERSGDEDEITQDDMAGSEDPNVVAFINRSKSIYKYDRDCNNQPITDNLCFFRCVLGKETNKFARDMRMRDVKRLYREYRDYRRSKRDPIIADYRHFPGVSEEDIQKFEEFRQVGVFTYKITIGVPNQDGATQEERDAREEARLARAAERQMANRVGPVELDAGELEADRRDAEMDRDEFAVTREDVEFVVPDNEQIQVDHSRDELDVLEERLGGERVELRDPETASDAGNSERPEIDSNVDSDEEILNVNRGPILESDEEEEEEDTPEPDEPVLTLIRRPIKTYSHPIHLVQYGQHFALIKSITTVCKCYQCPFCHTSWRHMSHYKSHIATCNNDVKKRYPGGGVGPRRTILYKLQDEGIDVGDPNDPYLFRGSYDFETMLVPRDEDPTARKLKDTHDCVPSSFAVCANTTDHPDTEESVGGVSADDRAFIPARCTINHNPKELMESFLNELEKIWEDAYDRMCAKYSGVLRTLRQKTDAIKRLKQEKRLLQGVAEDDDQAKMRLTEVTDELARTSKWEKLNAEFQTWITQLPMLGFNSARFDLNAIRRWFIPALYRRGEEIQHVIKRGNSYLSIATERFLFLDVMQYVAAGTSYATLLKMFGVEEGKGKFPYKWYTSPEKLDETEIPPPGEFYSELKGEGISAEDYQWLKDLWDRMGWTSMRQLLEWYNNCDVRPFLRAIARLFLIFREQYNLDMFKGGDISLPGLAYQHMLNQLKPHQILPLWTESNSDIRDKIAENLVGGPSIIFHREAVSDVPDDKVSEGPMRRVYLRNGKKIKRANGLDGIALYPSTYAKNIPTGLPVVYRPEGDVGEEVALHGDKNKPEEIAEFHKGVETNMAKKFKRHCPYAMYNYELQWITWKFKELQAEQNRLNTGVKLTLHHKFNGGQKRFVFGSKKSRFVDGWIPQLNTVLQYHGCSFHGHPDASCWGVQRLTPEERQRKERDTEETTKMLRDSGLNVIEKRHCEFKADMKIDGDLIEFLDENFKTPQTKLRNPMSAQQIMNGIMDESMFGLAEVDIQVPWFDVNGKDLRHEYDPFPPIFKNIEVTKADIGPVMRAHMGDAMEKPRRCLISSMFGTKILLTSDQIKYYTQELGLVVTRLYCFIQYTPMKVFESLVKDMANKRRAAANDPNMKPLADTIKKIVNSMYGKCCTRSDRHRRTTYVVKKDVAKNVNTSTFRALDYVGEGIYEMDFAKSTVNYNLPIEFAFFTYANAKLRMLEFYHFLVKSLGRDNFQLLEMDTDSLYMALSERTLRESVVNQEYYQREARNFLCATNTPGETLADGFKDNYEPGLFKLEYDGANMRCNNPKTYIAWEGDETSPTQTKRSSKGVSHRHNQFTPEDYGAAINDQASVSGRNLGFRVVEGGVRQYEQERTALTYDYIKREVLEDHITTRALKI